MPGIAVLAVRLGLRWAGLLSAKATELGDAVVVAVVWGAVIVNLTRQLVGARQPGDRLIAVSPALAARASSLAWIIATITGIGFVVSRTNSVIGASLAATVAANCVIALAYAAVFGLILSALGDDRAKDTDEQGSEAHDAPVRGAVVTLIALALTAAIVVTVGAVLGGFTTLAFLVANQVFWIGVLVALTYLVLRFADDALAELFRPGHRLAHFLTAVVNLGQPTVDQIGVVASAVIQVLVVLGAVSLALTPFGRNGDVVGARFAGASAIRLGSLVVSPRSMAIAVGCLLLGLGLVHIVDRWLARRFLPVTRWDAGVRNSVATGIRYLGIALVLLWALTAAGLGFGQIALIASALSVGIGFGLQQIVQNFVSGIILLIERPIKVGDLVNVGGIEGDVRNIRVRATEILQPDRTTLIVPNSDLITKPVQNKTLGDPRGRVQLALSIDAATDAARALELIAGVLHADAAVLADPAPSVYIDSLTPGGSVNFVAFAYVASPRDILRVRSALYLAAIMALINAGVRFVGAAGQVVIVEPGAGLRELTADFGERLTARAGGSVVASDPD
ncbi:mechanosensitive ion channel family protein [Sphingomonas bacterium]|uniref:mechanosensitive ion channel family protein n=1 Tax=Sphingomonas bacterium TaxID=1895847 RepID=UPI0015762229|nr:mechanosensitive ion channel domain-containing protein [Sphingomonas bacterium]